jgi:hypothetical protein
MTRYTSYGLDLSENQLEKIINAAKADKGTTVKLSNTTAEGPHKFLLTPTQIEKIKNNNGTLNLKLSAVQLREMEKSGGFLPLLALLPLIFGGIGAASGIAGGVASAVSSVKNVKTAAAALEEQIRHNKQVEEELKAGSGIISDRIENVPFIKKLVPYLRKIGLGVSTCKKIMDGETACTKSGVFVKQIGSGIYLGPSENFGSGLFLSPFLGQR